MRKGRKLKTDREKTRRAEEEEDERKFTEKDEERLKGDGDILAKKEKDLTQCQKVADELFSQGNTLLTKAIKGKTNHRCSGSTRHVGCSKERDETC